MGEHWRDDEHLNDSDAELEIREHLAAARKLAARRGWYAVTEGVDAIMEALDQE